MSSQRIRINWRIIGEKLCLLSSKRRKVMPNRRNQPFQQEYGLISIGVYPLPLMTNSVKDEGAYQEVLRSILLYIHTIKIIIYNYIITISKLNWNTRWMKREVLPHYISISMRKLPIEINFASYSLVDSNLTSLYLKPLCNRETAMSKSLAVYSNLSEVPP